MSDRREERIDKLVCVDARVPMQQISKTISSVASDTPVSVFSVDVPLYGSLAAEVLILADGNDGAATRAARFVWVANENAGYKRTTVLRESITSSSDAVVANRTISDITATASYSGSVCTLSVNVTHGGALSFSSRLRCLLRAIYSNRDYS